MKNNPVINWLLAMVREVPDEDAPVTYWLIGVIIGVFVLEVWLMMRFELGRVQVLAVGLFGVNPALAWSVSPLMHRGVGHWIASIIGLVFLGAAVERHWPWKRYLVFLGLAGYGSALFGAVVLLAFSDSKIAFYGASGIVFALAGFALTHLLWSHVQLTRVEWFAAFIGAVSLVQVVADVVAGPYLDPYWFNGGHMAGFVIGALAGRYEWDKCNLQY